MADDEATIRATIRAAHPPVGVVFARFHSQKGMEFIIPAGVLLDNIEGYRC
jgi:hypothetical protein